jgi:hypothetical protein
LIAEVDRKTLILVLVSLPLAGYKYWSFQKVSMIVVEIGYGYIGAGQQQDQRGPYMVDHLSFIRQLVAIHLAEMDPLLSSLSYEVWQDGVFLGASSKTIFHVTEKAIKKEDMPANIECCYDALRKLLIWRKLQAQQRGGDRSIAAPPLSSLL